MAKTNKPQTKKVKKPVPVCEENKDLKKLQEKLAREAAAKRVVSQEEHSKGASAESLFKPGHLPLKEAVIFSEIIGQPRCKSRYKRKSVK